MKNKRFYYDGRPLMKKNADYNLVIGQRSNGKTFFFCGTALTSYINNGARVAYVRRFSEDITKKNIENLFLPHPIEELTEGSYNGTVYRANKFRLCRYEEGVVAYTDEHVFCQTFALNTWERVKGADNGYFDYIIFDEFMTRGNYLPNEFVIFCNLLSTLMRDRDGTKIFMIANTVNKYCPYFDEMGIGEIFDTIRQGEIKVTTRDKLKIAVELCEQSENTAKVAKYFNFNNPALEMITAGKWEINNYPHLTERVTQDDILFRFYVRFDRKLFAGDVCLLNEDMFINFHTAKESEIKEDSFIYTTDNIGLNPYHAKTIYDGSFRAQKIIYGLIATQKMYYTSNDIGEVVRNWLKSQRTLKNALMT